LAQAGGLRQPGALFFKFFNCLLHKHASWLNLPEIELSALDKQYLSRRLATIEKFKAKSPTAHATATGRESTSTGLSTAKTPSECFPNSTGSDLWDSVLGPDLANKERKFYFFLESRFMRTEIVWRRVSPLCSFENN
jgi:hypothetical protein